MVYTPPIVPGTGDAALARRPGYGPGALVMPDAGALPADWLETGDRVLTRDHGPPPVRWDLAGQTMPPPLHPAPG